MKVQRETEYAQLVVVQERVAYRSRDPVHGFEVHRCRQFGVVQPVGKLGVRKQTETYAVAQYGILGAEVERHVEAFHVAASRLFGLHFEIACADHLAFVEVETFVGEVAAQRTVDRARSVPFDESKVAESFRK